jgi:hypothetical protein
VKAEWTAGRFGGETLNLELFWISVEYGLTSNSKGENGYVWRSSINAHSASGRRFASIEEAKAQAERWARRALARATALCPAARTSETPGGKL